jgi:hypothetical protein
MRVFGLAIKITPTGISMSAPTKYKDLPINLSGDIVMLAITPNEKTSGELLI